MAGKEIYTGVMLNTLNANIVSLEQSMRDMVKNLEIIKGSSTQNITSLKVRASNKVCVWSGGATSALLNGSISDNLVSTIFKFKSICDGSVMLIINGTCTQKYARYFVPNGTFRVRAKNQNGVIVCDSTFSYTEGVAVPFSANLTCPVTSGDTIEVQIATLSSGGDGSVGLSCAINTREIRYELANLYADGGISIL